MKHMVAITYHRVSIVPSYLGYDTSSMTEGNLSRNFTICPEKESAKLMRTPIQCEQLDAVADALEETGYKVKDACLDQDGAIRVYPKGDMGKPKDTPNGWRKVS